jgi:xylulokinase
VTSPLVLAFDLGTSGLKAAAVDSQGVIVDHQVVPLEVHLGGADGSAEQQPAAWWAAMVSAAQAMWKRGVAQPQHVVGVGLSSQWSGTVAVDAAGVPLRPALIWMDDRGADAVRELCAGFPTVDGYGVWKALSWLRVTGGLPSLSGKDPVGHIAWLQRHEPETYARAACFLEPKDWVNLKLSGRQVASFDSITLHWVTDNRNLAAVSYDESLIRRLGFHPEKFPALVPPASILGPVEAKAAEALSIPLTAQVVSGGADMHMAAIGAGTTRDFEPHLCLGTSSWLLAHVPFKKTDVPHNMGTLPAAMPGRYLFCNEQETAAAALKLVVEEWFGAQGPQAFTQALQQADAVGPGTDGLMYLPWLHGERSPVDDRLVRGGFVGLGLTHGRGHVVRAVLEGVAFNTRWLFKHLQENLGRPVSSIAIVGGGSRSPLWCQVHADVLGVEIRQIQSPQLANARGAALQAWVALGALSWGEVPSCVPVAATFTPRTAHRGLYDNQFERFLREFRHRRAESRKGFSGSHQ